MRVKEAYDSVLREALQFEQNSQERGHAASNGAQHPGGRYERHVSGRGRGAFNPLEQQRAAVTMADFDLDYLTSVQEALRCAPRQNTPAPNPTLTTYPYPCPCPCPLP